GGMRGPRRLRGQPAGAAAPREVQGTARHRGPPPGHGRADMSIAIPDDLNCNELVERVTDYLEDKLSLEDRTRLEQHLVWCPPCARYVRQIRAAARVSAELKGAPVSSAATEKLVAMFERWKRGQVQP